MLIPIQGDIRAGDLLTTPTIKIILDKMCKAVRVNRTSKYSDCSCVSSMLVKLKIEIHFSVESYRKTIGQKPQLKPTEINSG